MFLGKQINVPVILEGPSVYTLPDEFKDLSGAAFTDGNFENCSSSKTLIMWMCPSDVSSVLLS